MEVIMIKNYKIIGALKDRTQIWKVYMTRKSLF
jgi:hypothetical protein